MSKLKRRKLRKSIIFCKKEGCDLEAKKRGYCYYHYRTGIKNGSITRIRNLKGTVSGTTCIYKGCDRPAITKHLCTKHYQRLLSIGTLEPTAKMKYNTLSYKDRIKYNSKINEKTDCWEWQTGKSSDGYGQFWYKNENERSHRASYREFVGKIPKGLCVCHTCDNRVCVNPDHLFLGTNRDNMDDKVAKGRQTRGEKAGRSKLTRKDVVKIKLSFKKFKLFTKESFSSQCNKIAKKFNVSGKLIRNIYKNKVWKHVLLLKS